MNECNEYLILTLNCIGNSYYKTTSSLITMHQMCGIIVECISCMGLTAPLEGQVFETLFSKYKSGCPKRIRFENGL